MKNYIVLLLLFLSHFLFSQDIPEALKKYEREITVTHSKDTIFAEVYTGTKKNRMKYVWNYKTTVTAKNKTLEIIEFGGYNHTNREWDSKTIYNRPFNNTEFSKWYACEHGVLKKGSYIQTKITGQQVIF